MARLQHEDIITKQQDNPFTQQETDRNVDIQTDIENAYNQPEQQKVQFKREPEQIKSKMTSLKSIRTGAAV